MRYYFSFILCFLLFIPSTGCSQNSVDGNLHFSLFPDQNLFPYLNAAPYEGKTGIDFYPENNGLKVDLGSQIDILTVGHTPASPSVSFGIMFMAYAKIESYRNYRLQVLAMDGLFGGYCAYRIPTDNADFFLRLRFLHHSAHLVDGSYNEKSETWKNDREPVPYAKDFIDIHSGFLLTSEHYTIRPYMSFAYSVLIRPKEQKRISFSFGNAIYYSLQKQFLDKPYYLFFTYHGRLEGTKVYRLNSTLKSGIRFGKPANKGLEFYLSWYGGNSIFAEFYNEFTETLSIGFSIDIP